MTLLLNIDVPDVETGLRFYTTAFGLKVGRRFGADFVELLGWPATVYLLTKSAGTIGAGGDPRRYSRHWTPVHADIVVDDVDAAVARAVAAGGHSGLCDTGRGARPRGPLRHTGGAGPRGSEDEKPRHGVARSQQTTGAA